MKSGKMSKSPRKPNSVSAKNYKAAKNIHFYGKKKVGGKKNIPSDKYKRRFSLVNSDDEGSDSSLTNLSSEDGEDDKKNFYSTPVFSDSSDEEKDDEYWRAASAEVNAIMGSSSSEDDDEEDEEDSSSDDSDVDFVKLTAERKAKAMRAAKALKNPKQTRKPSVSSKTNKTHRKSVTTRKLSVSSRRFSVSKKDKHIELPDIDFTFEFDDANNNDSLSLQNEIDVNLLEDEDIGEEINLSLPTTPNIINSNTLLETDLIAVPKIKDSEFNSDEDYELDDNALLATLEADNDFAELQATNEDDDDFGFNPTYGDELFMREEENALVESFRDELGDLSSTNYTPRHSIVDTTTDSVENLVIEQSKPIMSEDSDDDDESDFDIPFFDTTNPSNIKNSTTFDIQEANSNSNNDSEDDAYLWNYFFSSGDEDDGDLGYSQSSDSYYYPTTIIDNDEIIMQQILKEVEEESGESTDEDLTLPPPSNKKIGSKMAKEILSNSNLDARPPILGTWITIDSKPFSIIDGLSTRSLLTNNDGVSSNSTNTSMTNLNLNLNGGGNEPLDLDELLYISELDDDNDDSEIWREFSNQQHKKNLVPLSAFRNKGLLLHNDHQQGLLNNLQSARRFSVINGAGAAGTHNQNSRRLSMSKKKMQLQKKRKLKNLNQMRRRRESIAEAAAEGLRTTKSGLFSENALASVEQALAGLDDGDDLLTLFKGI